MAHQVAVIGMGRFGYTVARELYRIGHDVLIVERDPALAQQMTGQVTYAVAGDSTSAEFLEEIGIRNFDTAVVAMGDIQSSIMTTVLLKQQFGVPEVAARAVSEVHGRTLQAVGADRVVYPEQEAASRTAQSLFQAATLEYMEISGGFGFSKINATPGMVGKTLEQNGLTTARNRYGTAVVAISRGREPILSPSKDEAIREGDVLVVAGRGASLEQLQLEPNA